MKLTRSTDSRTVVLLGDVHYVNVVADTNYWRSDICIKQTSGSKRVLITIRRDAQSIPASRFCALYR